MKYLAAIALVLAAAPARADDSWQIEAVQAALHEAKAPLHRCWEKAAAEDWHVAGEVKLKVTVGPRANRVDVISDATGKAGLADCVAAIFAAVSFGHAFTDGDAVELPVEFRAEPNVTVRVADVNPVKSGVVTAQVLIDKVSAGAEQASLSLVHVPAGAFAFYRGTIYFLSGEAAGSAEWGKVTLHPRTDSTILVLFTPPGPESTLRRGGSFRAPLDPPPLAGFVDPAKIGELELAGGKGSVKILVEEPEAYVGRMKLNAGVTIPEHVHDKSAEIVYVISGSGEMTVDGETYPVRPEMAIHIPAGARHSFKAQSPVDAVQFYAPAGPEERFKGTMK